MARLRSVVLVLSVLALAVVATLHWSQWRTGRPSLPHPVLQSGANGSVPLGRIWVDTDAACGVTRRTDPDDCLAIAWLISQDLDIVGISSSFGNAPGGVVIDRLGVLLSHFEGEGIRVPEVFPGHAEPDVGGPEPPGVAALRSALDEGPLTILALGPLTNIAAALRERPDLRPNVTRLVAVMGHQPGHLFHPTEGRGDGALFGHGPIFRDLNVSVDPDSVDFVLGMSLPVTLVPYDAARTIVIDNTSLVEISSRGPTWEWIAQTSRDWLSFWNEAIGVPGFYPFDWVAAAYLVHASDFSCAKVSAEIRVEWAFWLLPRRGLVVESNEDREPDVDSAMLYCPEVSPDLRERLLSN